IDAFGWIPADNPLAAREPDPRDEDAEVREEQERRDLERRNPGREAPECCGVERGLNEEHREIERRLRDERGVADERSDHRERYQPPAQLVARELPRQQAVAKR